MFFYQTLGLYSDRNRLVDTPHASKSALIRRNVRDDDDGALYVGTTRSLAVSAARTMRRGSATDKLIESSRTQAPVDTLIQDRSTQSRSSPVRCTVHKVCQSIFHSECPIPAANVLVRIRFDSIQFNPQFVYFQQK